MVPLPIVILIFISSNYTDLNSNNRITIPPTPRTLLHDKGPFNTDKNSQGSKSKVNDLSVSEIKFPDEISNKPGLEEEKIIREKIMPDDEETKSKQPVPLYSLVKNICEEGYALDENGVCQKVIAVRSGKTFESDRRRKRYIKEYDSFVSRFFRKPVPRNLGPNNNVNKNIANDGFGKIMTDCNRLYPGLVPDGAGGCTKAVLISHNNNNG